MTCCRVTTTALYREMRRMDESERVTRWLKEVADRFRITELDVLRLREQVLSPESKMRVRLYAIRNRILLDAWFSTCPATRMFTQFREDIVSDEAIEAIIADPPKYAGELQRKYRVTYVHAPMIFAAVLASEPVEVPTVAEVFGQEVSDICDRYLARLELES
jgi:hypothetical protein